MSKAKDIDVCLIKSLLIYDPRAGNSCLVWRINKGSRGKAGEHAGRKNHDGYWQVQINGKLYPAHRLVWAIENNEDPKCQLDHINGEKDDNRIENLRLAPRNELDNLQNQRLRKTNTSGFSGVSRNKKAKRWQSQIKVNNKYIYLGLFDTPELAYAAYIDAKSRLHKFQPTMRET